MNNTYGRLRRATLVLLALIVPENVFAKGCGKLILKGVIAGESVFTLVTLQDDLALPYNTPVKDVLGIGMGIGLGLGLAEGIYDCRRQGNQKPLPRNPASPISPPPASTGQEKKDGRFYQPLPRLLSEEELVAMVNPNIRWRKKNFLRGHNPATYEREVVCKGLIYDFNCRKLMAAFPGQQGVQRNASKNNNGHGAIRTVLAIMFSPIEKNDDGKVNKSFTALLSVYDGLQVGDYITTKIALSRGGAEENPSLAPIVNHEPAFALVKAFLGVGVPNVAFKYMHEESGMPVISYGFLAIQTGFYGYVVNNNINVIHALRHH